ncbi:MAG: hypothetical protein U0996_15030 [Planctomycetaceae bacterium]
MRLISLLAFSWISIASGLSAQQPTNTVAMATYSDIIEQLTIEGAASYSLPSIRVSLKSVPRLQHRLNDPADLKLMRDICQFYLTEGYRKEGYLDASVEAVIAEGKIKVTVKEGSRYHKGAIVIEGLSPDEAKQLEGALSKDSTNFHPPIIGADDKISKKYVAIWQKGTLPGSFESLNVSARTLAQTWLMDEGFGFATVNATAVKVPEKSAVELRIDIEKGARTPISDLRFEGLERNTAEEVMQYLSLPSSMDDSDRLRREIRNRLLSSGRFYAVQVWPDAPFAPEQAVPMNVRVRECADVPRLSEPLSEEQQAIVNFANWLSNWNASDEDLSVNLTLHSTPEAASPVFNINRMYLQTVWGHASPEAREFRLLISPQGSAVLTTGSSNEGVGSDRRTVWVGQETSGAHFHGSKQSFCIRNSDMGLAFSALFRAGEPDERGEIATIFSSGFDMSTGRRPAFGFELSFPPAVLLGATESVRRVRDNVFELRLRTDGIIVQFAPDTGQLIQIWHLDEDTELSVVPAKDVVRETIHSLATSDPRDAQKDDVFLPLVRFAILQYAHDLKKQGLTDESEIFLTLLDGSHWDEFQRELSRTDEGQKFPSTNPETDTMNINPLNPLEGLTQKGLQEKMFWMNGMQEVADIPDGEVVTDQQIVDGIESILQEHPSGIAFLNYVTRWIRGLSPGQLERLCQAIEQGEFVDATRGLNGRPLFQVVRAEPSDDPAVIRRRVIEFAWTFWLAKIMRYDVVEVDGNTYYLRWTVINAEAGDPGASGRFLNSSIEQLLPDVQPSQPAQVPQLRNPFAPVSNTAN